jgi:endoglucanase
MPLCRRLFLPLVALLSALALAPAAAQADPPFDPNGFRFTTAIQYVNENAGNAVVTITRTDTSREAQIRYITVGITAQAPYDYTPQKAMINFVKGQASATFDVPIIDHGVNGAPSTIKLALFGPSPIGVGVPSTSILTILNNDAPPPALTAANPLGLTDPAATSGANPIAGAHFYVDPDSEVARAAQQNPGLNVIASQPGAARFGHFSYPDAGTAVRRYLAKAAVVEPGTIPMLTTYRISSGHCGHWTTTPAEQASYHDFIEGFAHGIGSYRAVLLLEQDSLITVGCLTKRGVASRMAMLRDAINVLKANCPHLVIYLDAGAADAVQAPEIASLLKRAGVSLIQGFFLNATHFDWTLKEIKFGEKISKLTGGKHFIVNTGEAGQGPLIPHNRAKNGNEVLCNPAGRGLGPKPTTYTGYPNVDAFEWFDNPGGSGGTCAPGAPTAGTYWAQYGLMLIHNANYTVR